MSIIFCQLSEQKEALERLLPQIYHESAEQAKILDFVSHQTADGILAFETLQPVGFLLLQQAGHSADIIDIGTDKDFRCRGIATLMLQHYLDHMKGTKLQTLYLEVAIDNLPARAVYKKAGFIEIGRRIGYYRRRNGKGNISRVDALQLQYGPEL